MATKGRTITNKVIFKLVVDDKKMDFDTGSIAKKASTNFSSIASNAKNAGMAMTLGLSLPIAAAGTAALKTATEFEQGMANIQAVTRASADQMNRFEEAIRQVAKTTPYTTGEVASAVEELSKAGLTTEQILGGGLTGALTLAAAGEIDLGEAANLAARALITFKKDSLSVAEAADIMVGAANASTTSVGELGSSFEMVSVVAATAGMSFKDVATGLAVFAQNGMSGSDAGTSLKTMLMNLNPQTKKASDLMKDLGIITADGKNQFYDLNGNLKDLAGIAQVVQDAFQGMGTEARLSAMRIIFGQDAIRGASVLYESGAEGINQMADAMAKISAQEVAETKWATLANQWKILKNNAADLAIEISKRIIPVLTDLVKKAQGFLDMLGEMSPGMQNLILGFLAVVAAIGPVLLIFGNIASSIISLKTVFASFSKFMVPMSAAMFNPIVIAAGIAIAGIGLIGYSLYSESKRIKDGVKEIQSDISAVSASSGDLLEGYQENVMKASQGTLDKYSEMVGDTRESFQKMGYIMSDPKYQNEYLNNLDAMVKESQRILGQNNQSMENSLAGLFRNYSFLQENTEQDIYTNVVIANKAKVEAVSQYQERINKIVEQGVKNGNKFTTEQFKEMQDLMQKISDSTVESFTATNADLLLAKEGIVSQQGEADLEASKEFLKLNKEQSDKTIEMAKKTAGEELTALEWLKNQGLITLKDYDKARNDILQRYKDNVIAVQALEAQGIVDTNNQLQKWVDRYRELQEESQTYQNAQRNGIELTQEQKDRWEEISIMLDEQEGTYLAILDQINANKAALAGYSEEITSAMDNAHQGMQIFEDKIKNVEGKLRGLGDIDFAKIGFTIGQQLGLAFERGYLNTRAQALVQQLINVGGTLGAEGGAMTDAYDTSRFQASGGINRGGTTVVGEAGPELLTVGLTGAEVTPLSGAAKAQNVRDAFGGSNVFNISVEGGWDNADRIASRVADSINLILGNRGVNYVR